MSNKKKKHTKNNKTLNKNEKLNPATEKFFKNSTKNESIRKEKKIWFWLILCPPVGIYKSIKYKAFSTPVISIITTILLLILILRIDAILYPNRVVDYKVTQSIEKFDEIGDIRDFTKVGTLDEKFFIYTVITTKGEYDVYLSGDGNMTVEGIYQITPINKMVYKTDNLPKEYENIYSEIIRYFNDADVVKKYGNIVSYEDGLKDNHQIIITDKGRYSIEVQYNQVVAIYELDEKNNYNKLMQKKPEIVMPKDMKKAVEKSVDSIGKIKEIYGYKLTNKTQEYFFSTENNGHYKIVKYLDGSMEIFVKTDKTNDEEDIKTETVEDTSTENENN